MINQISFFNLDDTINNSSLKNKSNIEFQNTVTQLQKSYEYGKKIATFVSNQDEEISLNNNNDFIFSINDNDKTLKYESSSIRRFSSTFNQSSTNTSETTLKSEKELIQEQLKELQEQKRALKESIIAEAFAELNDEQNEVTVFLALNWQMNQYRTQIEAIEKYPTVTNTNKEVNKKYNAICEQLRKLTMAASSDPEADLSKDPVYQALIKQFNSLKSQLSKNEKFNTTKEKAPIEEKQKELAEHMEALMGQAIDNKRAAYNPVLEAMEWQEQQYILKLSQ